VSVVSRDLSYTIFYLLRALESMEPGLVRYGRECRLTQVTIMHTRSIRPDLWQARIALLAIIVLQFLVQTVIDMPAGRIWLLAGAEVVLLLSLTVASERHLRHIHAGGDVTRHFLGHHGGFSRVLAVILIGIVSLVNAIGLVSLIAALLTASKATGFSLLADAVNLFATNVIIFGLWYWELDRGGPFKRACTHPSPPDFLFPQMSLGDQERASINATNWRPCLIDYLFLAFTNATAFSPTDTLPLTVLAKISMMLQAAVSLMTIAIVAARAVNILG
jgi:hypothetical protein